MRLLPVFLFLTSTLHAQTRPRARGLGVPFDGTPGPFNAITDVAGVTVGHSTIIAGQGKLVVGQGPVRTGVTAIFPRGADKEVANRKVNEGANEIIKGLADGKMVHYLDIGPKFLEADGTLSREVMPDLLHLNEKSYRTWAESTEPKIKELLGEK